MNLSPLRYTCLPLMLFHLSSCGLVHKVFNKTKTSTEIQLQKNTDSTSVKKKDSTAITIIDSTQIKKKETVQQSGIDIHFTDSSETNTIEITTDAQGKQTIQATGRIRSVSTRNSQSAQHLDSSHYRKQNQNSYQMLDSTKTATQTQATLHEKTKTVSKEKETVRLPFYAYILLIVLTLLLLYFRLRKKIKDFFKL